MRGQARLGTLLALIAQPRIFLPLLALIYALAYLAHPATPGNNPVYPLGWWGWFDQGQYLRAAKAFAAHDLGPDNYYYPPLYPLLGALFLRLSTTHPFWLPDLVCLLWFAYVFVAFAARYLPRWAAVLLLYASTVASADIFETFVIPWTTTLAAALLSTGLYALTRGIDARRDGTGQRTWFGPLGLFATSVALGAIAALRPPDTLIAGLLWLALLWLAVRATAEGAGKMKACASAGLGMAIGPACFLAFNWRVFATPFGAYIRANSANGYFPADLGEKFVSIFLDSYPLYLEPHAALIDRYPWLLLALPACGYVLVRGDALLRLLAAAICVQFALYLPYGDLLPNGVWRFFNIHYFKWTLPYLALLACHASLSICRLMRRNPRQAWAWAAIFVAAALLQLSLRLELLPTPVVLEPGRSGTAPGLPPLVVDNLGTELDIIDIDGLRGGFTETYFGEHEMLADGQALHRVRDFRLLPAPWGARVLFLRPIAARTIVLRPDPRLSRDENLSASGGTYRFALGKPKPFRDEDEAAPVLPYVAGQRIDFSSAGSGQRYVRSGWSVGESWGRWSLGKTALLRLRLSPLPPASSISLQLRLLAYVNDRHPEQNVAVSVNGKQVRNLSFHAEQKGGEAREETIAANVGADGEIALSLYTPDAASPRSLGLGDDDRVLGVGLVSLRVLP